MAVTITQIFLGTNIQINDIIATADGDVAASYPILLGSGPIGASAIPGEVYITPMLPQALAARSAWAVFWQSLATLNLSLTKQASAGSGNPAVQLRVVIKSPQAPNAPGYNPNGSTPQQPLSL